MSNENSKIEKM